MRAHSSALFEAEALPHLSALYNFAVALAGPVDAEDFVQTTCVHALEHLDTYQPGTNIRAWLFTILRTSGSRGTAACSEVRSARGVCW